MHTLESRAGPAMYPEGVAQIAPPVPMPLLCSQTPSPLSATMLAADPYLPTLRQRPPSQTILPCHQRRSLAPSLSPCLPLLLPTVHPTMSDQARGNHGDAVRQTTDLLPPPPSNSSPPGFAMQRGVRACDARQRRRPVCSGRVLERRPRWFEHRRSSRTVGVLLAGGRMLPPRSRKAQWQLRLHPPPICVHKHMCSYDICGLSVLHADQGQNVMISKGRGKCS